MPLHHPPSNENAELYVRHRILDPDQPAGVRDAMDLMLALLEADHIPDCWSTKSAMEILAASQKESDRELNLTLARAVGENLRGIITDHEDEFWIKNALGKSNAQMVLDRLLESGTPQDLALADQIVKAWILREPLDNTALNYQKKMNSR